MLFSGSFTLAFRALIHFELAFINRLSLCSRGFLRCVCVCARAHIYLFIYLFVSGCLVMPVKRIVLGRFFVVLGQDMAGLFWSPVTGSQSFLGLCPQAIVFTSAV